MTLLGVMISPLQVGTIATAMAAAGQPRLDYFDFDGQVGPELIRGFVYSQLRRRVGKDIHNSQASDAFEVPLFIHGGRFSLTSLAQIGWQIRRFDRGEADIETLYAVTKRHLRDLPLEMMVPEYFHAEHRPALLVRLFDELMGVPDARVSRGLITTGIRPMALPISDLVGARPENLIATEVIEEDGRVLDIQGGKEGIAQIPYGEVKRDRIRERFADRDILPGTFYLSSLDSLWVALDSEVDWQRVVLINPSPRLLHAITLFQHLDPDMEGHEVAGVLEGLDNNGWIRECLVQAWQEGVMSRRFEILRGGLSNARRGTWSDEHKKFIYRHIQVPDWAPHYKEISRIRLNPPDTYAALYQAHPKYGTLFDLARKWEIPPSQLVFLMDMDMSHREVGTSNSIRRLFYSLRQSNSFSTYTDVVGQLTTLSSFEQMAAAFGDRFRGSLLLHDPRIQYRHLQMLLVVRDLFRGETDADQEKMIEAAPNLAALADPDSPLAESKLTLGDVRNLDEILIAYARLLKLEGDELEAITESEFIEVMGRRFGVTYFAEEQLLLESEITREPKVLIRRALEKRTGDTKGDPLDFPTDLTDASTGQWGKWSRMNHGVSVLPAREALEPNGVPVLETQGQSSMRETLAGVRDAVVENGLMGLAAVGGGTLVASGVSNVINGVSQILPSDQLMSDAASMGLVGGATFALWRSKLGNNPVIRMLDRSSAFLLGDVVTDGVFDGVAGGIPFSILGVMLASGLADGLFSAANGISEKITGKRPFIVESDNKPRLLMKELSHVVLTVGILYWLNLLR